MSRKEYSNIDNLILINNNTTTRQLNHTPTILPFLPTPHSNMATKTSIESLLAEFADITKSISTGTATPHDISRARKLKAIIAKVDKEITTRSNDFNDKRAHPLHVGTVWINPPPTCKDDIYKTQKQKQASQTVKIQIAQYPFARGGVRAAYHALCHFENGTTKKYVLKQFLDPRNQIRTEYLDQMETNSIAKYLAEQFRKSPAGRISGQRIEFLESRAIEVQDKKTKKKEWYNMEGVVEGNFDKWTDNNGMCSSSSEHQTLLKFAKWTYEWTNGFMMATDLQGAKNSKGWTLTDPAMLCEDLRRFGPTNFDSAQMRMCYTACSRVLATGVGGDVCGTSYAPGFTKYDDGAFWRKARAEADKRRKVDVRKMYGHKGRFQPRLGWDCCGSPSVTNLVCEIRVAEEKAKEKARKKKVAVAAARVIEEKKAEMEVDGAHDDRHPPWAREKREMLRSRAPYCYPNVEASEAHPNTVNRKWLNDAPNESEKTRRKAFIRREMKIYNDQEWEKMKSSCTVS